jgi:23S rRNA pseudouridine2605 synthase
VTGPNSERRIGLARALSKLGYCSRSQASELIRAGRVQLNGRLRHDPETPVRLGNDRIAVDGRAAGESEKLYLMLNKPRGLVTTASDEKGRATVYDCLPEHLRWIAPVGRLDKASEGLLLFSNDPEWADRILAPETHLEKTYHAQVRGVVTEPTIQSFLRGVDAGGELLRVKRASILRGGAKNTWIEIVLDQGKNRHIRRICEQLNLEVLRLVRVAIGPLRLGELKKSASRPLTAGEMKMLEQEMERNRA